MILPRTITPVLEKELHTREIVVITGMRQVGKTTLLTHLYATARSGNKALLDMGNPLHRRVFDEGNYDAIIRNLAPHGITSSRGASLFVDEIQNTPELPAAVKYLYDHYRIKFVLTGSSRYYFKHLFTESLAGRKVIFELFPLTFAEFLNFCGVRQSFHDDFPAKEKGKNAVAHETYAPYFRDYLSYGGFPSVVLEKDPLRKRKLLEGIFRSYFEIDVKNLSGFRELSRLQTLILLLCARVGSRIDVAKLASELGVSRETVYAYLSFLESTYFISLLPKYTKSIDRSAAGSKKLYLCDTGLARFLGTLSDGQALENAVHEMLRPTHHLAYYSKPSGAELDFVVDGSWGLEVKHMPSRRDVTHVKRWAGELGLADGFVVSGRYSDLDGVIMAHDM